MLVGAGGWALHVAAISFAPLSVVQVVLSGGVVLIAVMADRLFGFEVGRRQWWGLGLTAVGLILLGVTMPQPHTAHSTFSLAAMVSFEAVLLGLGGLLILGPRAGAPAEHHGVMLAAAAGILFGVCNVAVKALTGIVGADGRRSASSAPGSSSPPSARPPPSSPRRASLQDGEAVAGHRHHRHRGQHLLHRRRHPRLRRPAARATPRDRRPGRRLRDGHRRLGPDARPGALGRERPRRRPAAAAA